MEVALRLVEWTAPTLPTRTSAPSSVPQNLRRCFVPDLLPEVVPVWMDDGSRLIVATVEGIAIVNDQLEVEHIKHGMKTSVTALAWSSQEKRLYSVYRDSGTIWTSCLDGVSEPCLKFSECCSPGRPYTCRHVTVNPTRPNVVAAAALDGGISDKLVVWVNGVVVFQEQCVFKNQLMSVLQWSPNGQVLGIQTPQSIKFWSLSTCSFIVSNAPKNRQEFGLGWINSAEYAILFDPGPHALFECLPYRVIYNRWCAQVWRDQKVWKTIRAGDNKFLVGAVCANKLALLCENGHVLIDPDMSHQDVGELPPPLVELSLFGRGAEVIQATQHQLAPLRPTKMSKVSETKPVWKGACEGQPVVVKESNPNSYYALNELHQAATIPPHPNLARIIGVEKDADLVYEKIRGPMTTVEQQATHMTEFQKVHVALSVMAALEHLHEHGYVHGDIKCDNIVVNKDCSEVQVIDFDRTQPLEHLHPKIGCGLFYKESSVEEEWRVFHEHVLKVLWPQQDRLMDKDPKKTRKKLEEHRIFIARNARVRAWLVHHGRVEVVERKQHNGVICAPLPYINVYQEKDTGVFWRAIMGSTHPEDGERFDDPDLCDTALYGSILIGYLTNETSFSCRENDDDNFDHPPIIPAKLLDFSPSARFWVSCKDYANDYVIDDPLWLERHNLGLLLGAQLQPRIYVVSDSN